MVSVCVCVWITYREVPEVREMPLPGEASCSQHCSQLICMLVFLPTFQQVHAIRGGGVALVGNTRESGDVRKKTQV